MAKGWALNIGLNFVDPGHYAGWSGELKACEADARDMAAIADSCGFAKTVLLTKASTRETIKSAMAKMARSLKAGDIFLLSYSGHGGQLPDMNDDEPDGQDETWCLYDGELVDDELHALLAGFAQGVRILVFSDSCHSGTVTKAAYYHGTAAARTAAGESGGFCYRAMPPSIALRTYENNRAFYDPILKSTDMKAAAKNVRASVLLLSGCQDNQFSADGEFNGLFTSQLLQVWKNGAFKGDYIGFHKAIVRRMPPDQTPNFFRTGATDARFEKQRPFTI